MSTDFLHARQAVLIAAAAQRVRFGGPLTPTACATLLSEMTTGFERHVARAACDLLDGKKLTSKTNADKAATILVGWSMHPPAPRRRRRRER